MDGVWQAKKLWRPSSVVSLFEDGCIENAASYYDFGPRYVVRSPHIGGAPDVANSLYAIEKLVFEEKKLSLAALVRILKDNWEGHETLRVYVRDNYSYYGNDTDAGAMQTSRGGIPVCTISIPCRYVHSACETIDMRDMDAALKLLTAYLKK